MNELREQVEALQWYHTLELAPGLDTPGWFDLRAVAPRMPIPASLEGKRCLDVGTFDGFWAFEMERRGASAVVAIDILDPYRWDWPAGSTEETLVAINKRKAGGTGFEIARRELGSAVSRREVSIYDLDPDEVGTFDVVYVGSLLLHLRDPVRGLEGVRRVCSGSLVLCDAIDTFTSVLFWRRPLATLDGLGRPWWWKPNLAGLERMVIAAGFELTAPPARIRMTPGRGHPRLRPHPRMLVSRVAREEAFRGWRGDAHGIIVARPRPGLEPLDGG